MEVVIHVARKWSYLIFLRKFAHADCAFLMLLEVVLVVLLFDQSIDYVKDIGSLTSTSIHVLSNSRNDTGEAAKTNTNSNSHKNGRPNCNGKDC